MAKQKRTATNKKVGKAGRGSRTAPAMPKNKAGAIVLTALTIGAAGVLTYLGWQYMKKRKQKNSPNLDEALLRSQSPGSTNAITDSTAATVMDTLSPLPGNITTTPYIPASVTIPRTGSSAKGSAAGDDFPLKRGSKGDNVRVLQEALMKKYGSKILPKYGADGGFGAETAAALKKLKMPATISETFFNVLTQGGGSSTDDSSVSMSELAGKIYNATIRRDFNTVLSLLKNIKSSSDYSSVSDGFKQYRINGVRQTLVNGLLNIFSSNAQKQQLRLAFATMGLTYDGSKWSLSGIDGIPIVTTMPAKVWINATTCVTVPARMVLGHEVTRRLQYVLFANNGRHFLVHSNCIQQL